MSVPLISGFFFHLLVPTVSVYCVSAFVLSLNSIASPYLSIVCATSNIAASQALAAKGERQRGKMTSACTITEAIADILEDLSEQNFEKFRHLLLDRRTNPRIKRGRVEGKNFLGVTEVMVSTFTEDGALTVTEELLRKIGLNAEANHLGKMCFELKYWT